MAQVSFTTMGTCGAKA